MKWKNGKLGNFEIHKTLNGTHCPDVHTHFDHDVDMAQLVDAYLGGKLAEGMQSIERGKKMAKKEKETWDAVLAGKKPFDEGLKVHHKNTVRRGSAIDLHEVAASAEHVQCPGCGGDLGRIGATARWVGPEYEASIERARLIGLKASTEYTAKAARRLGIRNGEELEIWLDGAKADKVKKILRDTLGKLEEAPLGFGMSEIVTDIESAIDRIDREMHQRGIDFVNAVDDAIKEDIFPGVSGGVSEDKKKLLENPRLRTADK